MQSKHFPGYPRMARPKIAAEVFNTTPERLANDRLRSTGFPYLRQGRTVLYDLDVCYEFALNAGSGQEAAA